MCCQRGKRCACATRTACITSSTCVIPQNARLFSIQSSQKLWSDGSNDTIMMMLIVDCYHFVFALDSKLFHQIPNSDLWWSLSTITTALNIISIIINSSIIFRFCIFVGLQTIFPTSFQIWKLTFELWAKKRPTFSSSTGPTLCVRHSNRMRHLYWVLLSPCMHYNALLLLSQVMVWEWAK